MKKLLVLAVTLVTAAGIGLAVATATPRAGELHATKECSHFFGVAGGYCTITSANLNAIGAGMNVVYLSNAGATALDSDLVLDGPGNNDAYGHVNLPFATGSGVVTFSGGTGRFRGFHASIAVTFNMSDNLWHWDGTYSFIPPGHDK